MHGKLTLVALRTCLLYGCVSAFWILFSDRLLEAIVTDPIVHARLHTYKGLAFVTFTSLLLYVTLHRQLLSLDKVFARRRKAEASLRESETRNRKAKEEWEQTFDAVPDLIAILDLQHRIVRVNQAMADRLGAAPDECIGRPCYECVHGATEPPLFCPHAELLQDGRAHAVEVHEPHLQGVFHVTVSPLFDAAGALQGSVHVAHDITERKRAEEALRENMERLRLALDAAKAGAWEWDLRTGVNVWSEELWPLYGLQPHSCTPSYEAWRQTLHPEDRARAEQAVQDAANQGTELNAEWRVCDRDGAERWLMSRGRPVRDAQGQTLRYLGIVLDITQRRQGEQQRIQIEQQIQQTQKLESLGVLAGGIAHDFNNLLTAIMGHADLALLELPPLAPARVNINQIERASRRAADLCRQMLAYSGRCKFLIESIDLRELIEEMLHLLKTSISKKAILHLSLEKDLPPMRGDATQIRQIVMNLVINASEAIGERSGVIAIATGALDCSRDLLANTCFGEKLAPGLYLWLEVSDTGCGMDEETQSRLFEPFFTTKFTGRGLGMAAVMGIVRGHKGAIKLHSQPGQGTTFKAFFPIAAEQAAPAEKNNDDLSRHWKGSGRILLADDEESIRALGKKMLEKLGFQVLTAADGREALEIYQAPGSRIDLVLLDLTMPRLNGEETFRELRRIDPAVRVIISSGYTESEIVARFDGAEVNGYVQKPYALATLRDRVRDVLTA